MSQIKGALLQETNLQYLLEISNHRTHAQREVV